LQVPSSPFIKLLILFRRAEFSWRPILLILLHWRLSFKMILEVIQTSKHSTYLADFNSWFIILYYCFLSCIFILLITWSHFSHPFLHCLLAVTPINLEVKLCLLILPTDNEIYTTLLIYLN
jgi:hypothetical protein